jgi:hypothetical protein
LLDYAVAGSEIQLCWHAQDLDPGAALGRCLVLALGHRRLQPVVAVRCRVSGYGLMVACLGV